MSDKKTSSSKTRAQAFALMDQLPHENNGFQPRAESPLHHVDLATIETKNPNEGAVELHENKFLGHLVLRGNIKDKNFLTGTKKVLGFDLPGPLHSNQNENISAYWISPDEWILIVPAEQAFQLEREIREAINGHFAIVNVSGGQTVINLSGPNALHVLKKSVPYDFHKRNFPVGKVVTAVFAKSQAVIVRSSADSWKLLIRRSFADYIWLWLQSASAEYGLVVKE